MTGGKRPNTYASRTCRACRDAKRCCKLPQSALLELPSYQRVTPCTRCERLDLPCILDDFAKRSKIERKRKSQQEEPTPTLKTNGVLGSRLLLLELVRQAREPRDASTSEERFKTVSMDDLDAIIDCEMSQHLSSW